MIGALAREPTFVSLAPPDCYPFAEWPLISSAGLRIAPREWDQHFAVQFPENGKITQRRRESDDGTGIDDDGEGIRHVQDRIGAHLPQDRSWAHRSDASSAKS